jgi:hypothetical protein
VTRPQGVKLLGAEMKRRIRRHCFSPCANALIEAEDWEGPAYQAREGYDEGFQMGLEAKTPPEPEPPPPKSES